jgi:hypothetical protein
VAGLEGVDRFELRARATQRIRDTYLDTGEGTLGAARVAVRVRELDGRPLLTLKADAVRSGLASERLELEAPWSAGAMGAALEELRRRGIELPDPPEGAGAGEPLADLGGLGLRPTQLRETTRTPRDVLERGGLETEQALLEALAEGFPGELRPWPYGKLATGRAVEQLLAAGRLEGLLGPDDRIRPAAHDLLAEFLAANSP